MSKKHLLLVFSTALISGFAIFINSFGVKISDPTQYTFLKNLFPVLVISSILLFKYNIKHFKNLLKKDWILLVLIGLIGGSVPFILFFEGLSNTSGTSGAFIHKTLFIWMSILAILFLKEKVKILFMVPALAILFGTFLLLKVDLGSFSIFHLFILTATILWAIENVLSKYLINSGVSPLIVIWSRMTFGCGFIFLYLLLKSNIPTISDINLNILLWIVISGMFLTGYLLTWYIGISKTSLSLAGSILTLGLPITAVLNFIFKGKQLIPEQILGILLISAGICFAVYLFIDIGKSISQIADLKTAQSNQEQ